MSSLFNYQGFACHRYIEQFRIPGAYLTVSQLSTGLKDFWVNFLSNGQIKKRQYFFVCFHIPKAFAENVIDGMRLLKKEPCSNPILYFYSVHLKSVDRLHKTVHVTKSSNVHHKQYTFIAVRRTL